MVNRGSEEMWEGVITLRRCDSPQGGAKCIRKVCQLMERCDAHRRGVQELGEVSQLSGSATRSH